MDDVLFPGVTQGTLFVTDTPTNKVYEVRLTGLDPNTPIISLGDFGEVATVNPLTGVVETPLLTGLTAPHGLDFIPFAVPESSTWAMLLLGFAGLGYAGYRRARRPIALSTPVGQEGATPRTSPWTHHGCWSNGLAVGERGCSSRGGGAWFGTTAPQKRELT
jgi:hypothetical protein